MLEPIACVIIAPDGNRHRASLPVSIVKTDGAEAPEGLISRLGLFSDARMRWRLRSLRCQGKQEHCQEVSSAGEESLPILCLVRTVIAGAGKTPFNPRQARLKKERMAMMRLNEESDYVRVEPLEVMEGSEPERYRVTFFCRGIIRTDASQQPVFGDKHEILIQCDDEFPADVPKMRWETPIWHPNIQHTEPKGICVNKAEWLGGMGLDDLTRLMFEMVQYKNYHAELSPPFPFDVEAANWVRDYAEPRGIVDKKRGIFVDDKPFSRPTLAQPGGVASQTTGRIKLITPDAPTVSASRIRLINPAGVPSAPSTSTPRIRITKSE